jgi:hypothetical protein
MVFVGDAQAAAEITQFIEMGAVSGRFRGAQTQGEAMVLKRADAFDRLLPASWTTIGIMMFGAAAVQAYLNL